MYFFFFSFLVSDHIFAPNQTVNLSELESEERDIESFKRFDYFFDPPKNKPKINLNIKDIVVNKRQQQSPHSTHESSDGIGGGNLSGGIGGGGAGLLNPTFNNHQTFIDYLKNQNLRNGFAMNSAPTIDSDIKYKYDSCMD